MRIVIQNARVIDPSQNKDELLDVILAKGVVEGFEKPFSAKTDGAEVFDATGLCVAPGFVELHAHLREPGFEYKETIESGTQSAVRGGYTTVCCMANTKPVNDSVLVTQYIVEKAKATAACRVYPLGSMTMGLKGEALSPMGELKKAGCVAVSDDGLTVQNAQMMRLALEYAKTFDLPVSTHSLDAHLSHKGSMNESVHSLTCGLKGSPKVAEDIIIARDIYLAELTGAHLHIGHLSTKEGVRLVKEAKAKGLNVSAEVAPHHFTLTDADIENFDTSYKMCPPLRGSEDVEALRQGLAEGVIEAIATDHAPHARIDKEVAFSEAAFGIIGFETALPLSLRLVEAGYLTLNQMIEKLTSSPARLFKLPGGTLKKGVAADLVVFDLNARWVFDLNHVGSKSQNSPFLNQEMKGQVIRTYVGGDLKFDCHQALEKGKSL